MLNIHTLVLHSQRDTPIRRGVEIHRKAALALKTRRIYLKGMSFRKNPEKQDFISEEIIRQALLCQWQPDGAGIG